MNNKKKQDLFHYSLDLEEAISLLDGESKWRGNASGFQRAKEVRKALLRGTVIIRKRLKEIITTDERLYLTTSIAVDSLEKEVRALTEDSNNQIEIISKMLKLLGYLLGYDWLSGETNRQVIYYQTLEQMKLDDRMRHPGGVPGKLEFEKRTEIACELFDDGLRLTQISSIMNISESIVKSMLVRSGRISREVQTRNT